MSALTAVSESMIPQQSDRSSSIPIFPIDIDRREELLDFKSPDPPPDTYLIAGILLRLELVPQIILAE